MSGACSGAIHTGHVFESTCTVFQIVLLFKNHNVMEGATDLFFRVVMYMIQVKQIEKKNVGRVWIDADLNASLQFKRVEKSGTRHPREEKTVLNICFMQ